MEETLVEEQEEGELAHLSWVRNYDRPLPQVENYFCRKENHYFDFAGDCVALFPQRVQSV